MSETGAVPSQDGAGRGPDGEGLAAAPHEDSQSEHQLKPPRRLRSPTCQLHRVAADASGLGGGISDDSSPLSVLIWQVSRHVTQTSK